MRCYCIAHGRDMNSTRIVRQGVSPSFKHLDVGFDTLDVALGAGLLIHNVRGKDRPQLGPISGIECVNRLRCGLNFVDGHTQLSWNEDDTLLTGVNRP